ncbi:hypothetical protein Ciccas_010334 [Cichlidogyrus casuarinus]|uniref:Hikeshi-like domain-containing protein n=1 Tax=Cichlidogyrus casuarinus TaxID=1844966 RepID=A0ABD2PVL1_9PLAT
MFAYLIPGKLVRPLHFILIKFQPVNQFQQITENSIVFDIPCVKDVNHLVVMMTGELTLPDGCGAATSESQTQQLHPFSNNSFLTNNNEIVHAKLGLTVESLANLVSQEPAIGSQVEENIQPAILSQFTQYAAQNLYDFTASFAHDRIPGQETFIPLSSIKSWFDRMHEKLSINPSFWKSQSNQ